MCVSTVCIFSTLVVVHVYHTVCCILESVIYSYAIGYIRRAPNNESPWSYLRGWVWSLW